MPIIKSDSLYQSTGVNQVNPQHSSWWFEAQLKVSVRCGSNEVRKAVGLCLTWEIEVYHIMNISFYHTLKSFVHFWKILSNQGPGHCCSDNSSIFLSSSGPDGSTSQFHCAHAHCQVSVYLHLSLGPQCLNPLLCCGASVLYSRSARCIWSQCLCMLLSFGILPPFT